MEIPPACGRGTAQTEIVSVGSPQKGKNLTLKGRREAEHAHYFCILHPH